ncbi:MAG TPA: metalloregulator ArsR/SmtB family transcription factor [Actinomycetota bacterium]|nr:metalloregulator ArsR/SmtB family transcription factor [Actinomycetota bacterium]
MSERRVGTAGEASEADEVFVALADPTRRQLLDVLAARGEASATTLAVVLPVSRQAVVKHLAVLGRAGLVRGVRRGREVRYTVRPERLDATARWLAGLAAEWDTRLAAIKRLAEADEPPRRS